MSSNKPKKKAQYKPSRNSRKPTPDRRPPTLLRRQSTRNSKGLETISEPGTVVSDASEIQERARFSTPSGANVRLNQEIQDYLDLTGLDGNFRMILNRLLDRIDLPYNPYPGFVVRMRKFSERFYLESHTIEKIEASLRKFLAETNVMNLFTLKEDSCVWGLESILPVINPSTLYHYKWLIDNITPSKDKLVYDEDYNVDVMVALVGPTIFLGSFYYQTHLVHTRITYLISGSSIQEGVPLFVNNVMSDIDLMYDDKNHRLLGVNVPVRSGEGKNIEWNLTFWDPATIQEQKVDFLQVMSDAVIGNRYIYVECVFRLDPNQISYVRGQKQYALNFIEIADNLREKGLSSFSEYPLSSLHEGIFLDQTQAETYLGVFTPHTDEADNQNIHIGSARGMTRQSSNRRLSSAMGVSGLQTHVYQQLERYKPRKIRIDGFKLGDDPGSGPFAWQIISPLRTFYQRNIAKLSPTGELFESVYNVLLLVLMERSFYPAGILHEIYRLLHSTPGRLYLIMEQNKSIRALLRGFANTEDIYIVRYLLSRYKNDIEELLSYSLQERSMDMCVSGKYITAQIDDLLAPDDFVFGSASHLMLIVSTLRNINYYCQTLAIHLAEDCLQWCPNLVELIEKMQATFPEDMTRPQTKVRERKDQNTVNKKSSGGKFNDEDVEYKHGMEDEIINQHENSVINVEMCIERDTAPKIISTESVLMKYMIDCHLDDTWYNYLSEIFTGEYLLPNPYPRLVTRLRQAAMRMDLWFEKPATLLKRILDQQPKQVDSENFVYQIPNYNLYGPLSIMRLIDPVTLTLIGDIITKHFIPRQYIQRKGPYRVGICPAISGNTIWYGKLQTYLPDITIDEHYYIQGPTGSEKDVRQLFTQIVHSHVCELIERKTYPVMGVYMGDEEVRWPWEDILNKRKGFWTEMEMVASRKEPAYLKAYIVMDGWRYVPVRKNFLLHFLSNDGESNELMFQEDPSSFYQSIFLSPDRSAFHFQNGGPPRSGDPMSEPNVRSADIHLKQKITKAKEHCDWLNVHRLLLLKSAMYQSNDHIVDSWRVLHSVASVSEYVTSLATTLKDLTIFNMEYIKWLNLVYGDDDATEVNSFANSTIGKKEPLDSRILSKMTRAFEQKLFELTDARISMMADDFSQIIMDKLKTIIEKDKHSQDVFPIPETQTIHILDEISHMLKGIEITTGHDIHSICGDEVNIDIFNNNQTNRPISVASTQLDNPNRYHHPPRAIYRILNKEDYYVQKG